MGWPAGSSGDGAILADLVAPDHTQIYVTAEPVGGPRTRAPSGKCRLRPPVCPGWRLTRRRLEYRMNTEDSPDPRVHQEKIQRQLDELIEHLRKDVARVSEPRFQALLETTAEVLTGLRTAFAHYREKKEPAWGGKEPDGQPG